MSAHEMSRESRLRERLLRLDAHIRFEFELTAQRMTYLAIAESFLFSTFILSLANSNSPSVHPLMLKVIAYVPWFGILLSAIVLAAVLGSISLTRKLRQERHALEQVLEDSVLHTDLSKQSLEIFLGHLPPICVSLAFLSAWLLIWPSSGNL